MQTDFHDIEQMLAHDLHEVAEAVQAPQLPALPSPQGAVVVRPRRWLAPLAAAAAVLLLLVGASVLAHHDRAPGPAQHGIPKGAPAVPFIVGQVLYVDGAPLPGRWLSVVSAGNTWVGARAGGWWWGYGEQVHRAPVPRDSLPRISLDGRVLAFADNSGGGRIQVIEAASGQTLGTWHVPLGGIGSAQALIPVAVTSPDVRVFVQGPARARFWTLSTGRVTQLPRGVHVIDDTPAGLVLADARARFHLGSIDAAGRVHYRAALSPALGAISADGWMLDFVARDSVRVEGLGRVDDTTTLQVARVDGTRKLTLAMPAGWVATAAAWEAPGRIVVDAVPAGRSVVSPAAARLVRCVVSLSRCAVVER